MAGEWREVAIAEAPLEIIDGDRGTNYPKQDDFASIGHCLFLNAGNVTNAGFSLSGCSFISKDKDAALRKGKAKRDDVVLTTRGTVGNVALYDASVPYEHVRINSGMVLLRPDSSKLSPRFLYQFVRSAVFRERVAALTTGSAQPQLPIRDIRRIEFPLPPLPEQRAIAHILGTLDDKIDLNSRLNQTLEAMARALFKDWFVDFGPVRAKMEGREPYLPADIWQLFPGRLDDEGKPEGWEMVSASELIEFNPTEPLRKGTSAPYLDMASLPTSGSWPEPPIMRDFGSGMRFRNGDSLLARITPCLENGKTALVQCLPDEIVGWGSTEYIVMRPKAPVPAGYAYLLARDDAFREHAIRSMTGTSGRQRAQGDSVATFKLASPPDEYIWHAFERQVSPTFESIKFNAKTSETLSALRDTLLPKLISGELRIADEEKFMKRAQVQTTQRSQP